MSTADIEDLRATLIKRNRSYTSSEKYRVIAGSLFDKTIKRKITGSKNSDMKSRSDTLGSIFTYKED